MTGQVKLTRAHVGAPGRRGPVLPIDKTSKRLPSLINDMQLVVIEDGPHAISWTHADQVNTALVDFQHT